MCRTDNRDALRNGGAADLATQGRAIADILDALAEIPTRDEVLDMIQKSLAIHASSCASARPQPKKTEPTKFHLGKGGLEMEGRAAMLTGVLLGGVVVFLLVKVAPYIDSWLQAWKGGA